MNTRHVLFLILGAAILAACAPKYGVQKPEDLTVFDHVEVFNGFKGLVLEVDMANQKLVPLGPKNPKCLGEIKKHKGCLYVRKGRRTYLRFKLTEADIENGWVFTEFSLCRGENKPTQPCTLEYRDRVQFYAAKKKNSRTVQKTEANGVIKLQDLSEELTDFVVYDENVFRRDYFYNIKACKQANLNNCVDLDPGLRNKGR